MGRTIYITENQYNDLVESNSTRSSKKENIMASVKANRKKRREEYKDTYGDGFKPTTRISKSEKTYSRKGKNKFNKNFIDNEY